WLLYCAPLALWFAGAHVPVQVFGVLVLAQISQHAAGAVFGEHVLCDFTNNTKQLEQERVIFDREQRRDVTLGNDDDVYRPEWSRVMVSKHVVSLTDDPHKRSPAQYFIAEKIFSHQPPILRQSVIFFGTHGGVASEIAQKNSALPISYHPTGGEFPMFLRTILFSTL